MQAAILQARTHHRHVAGVINHALLLLEGALVLLVHHQQPEIGEGQKQRRTGADHHRGLPSATARQVARRTRAGRSECQAAGRMPKRAAKRSSHCAESAISGSRTRACRPARRQAAMASK